MHSSDEPAETGGPGLSSACELPRESHDILAEVHAGALAATLAHITGDLTWMAFRSDGRMKEREAEARATLASYAEAKSVPCESPRTVLEGILGYLVDEVSGGLVEKLRFHLGDPDPREPRLAWVDAVPTEARPKITIVGAGMSGLGLAVKAHNAGLEVELLEKNEALGGVWFENTYPNCGVDTPAMQYEWEGAANFWSRPDPKRDEILEYIRRYAQTVQPRIRYRHELTRAAWDSDSHQWQLTVASDNDTYTSMTEILVLAVGALNRPKVPRIPGLQDFKGSYFHTAQWDHSVDLTDKRVALVGNGSSGTQAGPWIAQRAKTLYAFQRSPHWVSPRDIYEGSGVKAHWLIAHVPLYRRWLRFLLDLESDRHFGRLKRDPIWRVSSVNRENDELRTRLEQFISDETSAKPHLADRLTPEYPPYGKRLVLDAGWYRALTRDNVNLITETIAAVHPNGIRSAAGDIYEVDVIVFATGFHGTRYFWPLDIFGARGHAVTGQDASRDDLRSYLGVAMPGYPNLFTVQGPNSTLGHGGSATMISECQQRLILDSLRLMLERSATSIECRADVFRDYNNHLDASLARMVWSEPGLRSRYRNDQGRNVMTHPWTLLDFFEMTRVANETDFHFSSLSDAAPELAEQFDTGGNFV